jgi:hypothetical protein
VLIEVDAREDCANAEDFYRSLRARTGHVRLAGASEAHLTVRVRLQETRRSVFGELRISGVRGESDLRKVQGQNCEEVVQALAFAAAVALDPNLLLSTPAPAPASVTPAPAGPSAGDPPDPMKNPGLDPLATPAASPAARREPRFAFGLAAVGMILLSSSLSPGLAVSGRYRYAGGNGFGPTVGITLTHLRNDALGAPGVAQASLTGMGVAVCGQGWGASVVRVKPCGALTGGWLSVRGERVANQATVGLAWLGAGATGRGEIRIGGNLSLFLEAGMEIPLLPQRAFYTTSSDHVVAGTPRISPRLELGIAYGYAGRP